MTLTPFVIQSLDEIIKEKSKEFLNKQIDIENKNTLPGNGEYTHIKWFKIPEVTAVFVDLKNSTGLSASKHEKGTALIYEYFTGTIIRLFHELDAEYVDVKGDGVFALYSKNKANTALAAAVTVKTFCSSYFLKLVKDYLPADFDIGFHMGIDQKTVLVKKVGLQDREGRDSRKNEVWAGKPINMAAKLASLSNNELVVSDRFYKSVNSSELVTLSCGCTNGTAGIKKENIWFSINLSNESKKFDFDTAWKLKAETVWCVHHGYEYFKQIKALDN